MKAIRLSFLQMIQFIRRDKMLFAASLAPLLAGLAIKLGIPFLENLLVSWSGKTSILSPYYGLFDLFFSMISPVMFCFVAAMVILEERDDHICHYLFVTGLGRMGYLLSRICIPALCAFTVTLILLPFFKLTALSAGAIFFLAVTGTLQGIIIALLVVTLSTNKLEGMAVTKLSTLLILGALIPYFIQEKVQYILSILPSFWSGKAVLEQDLRYMLLSVFMAAIWIFLLLKKFQVKIS